MRQSCVAKNSYARASLPSTAQPPGLIFSGTARNDLYASRGRNHSSPHSKETFPMRSSRLQQKETNTARCCDCSWRRNPSHWKENRNGQQRSLHFFPANYQNLSVWIAPEECGAVRPPVIFRTNLAVQPNHTATRLPRWRNAARVRSSGGNRMLASSPPVDVRQKNALGSVLPTDHFSSLRSKKQALGLRDCSLQTTSVAGGQGSKSCAHDQRDGGQRYRAAKSHLLGVLVQAVVRWCASSSRAGFCSGDV